MNYNVYFCMFQLHIAAANGYLDVVEFLINQRVSMEVRDEDGWLPIHAAACWLQVIYSHI